FTYNCPITFSWYVTIFHSHCLEIGLHKGVGYTINVHVQRIRQEVIMVNTNGIICYQCAVYILFYFLCVGIIRCFKC
ncbi:hypothetical protein VIGAN_08062900, partial [Vigna angularis var. angularis]